jgi:hypothetical protein
MLILYWTKDITDKTARAAFAARRREFSFVTGDAAHFFFQFHGKQAENG